MQAAFADDSLGRMIRSLIALCLIAAMAHADSPPPPPPPKKEPAMSSPKIESVKRDLSATLAKQFKGAKIDTRAEAGPVGLTVITAAVPGAYPGSGVLRVLIDDHEVTYGVHGEKDFADLVRARHWIEKDPPDADTLRRLVDFAFFEGVAIWMDSPPPLYTRTHDTLTITAYRTWHPSGGKTRVQVRVPASGKAEVQSVNEK